MGLHQVCLLAFGTADDRLVTVVGNDHVPGIALPPFDLDQPVMHDQLESLFFDFPAQIAGCESGIQDD